MATENAGSGANGAPREQGRQPGIERDMQPRPESTMKDYAAAGKLRGRVVLITGGDSGIGRAVAIAGDVGDAAFCRELVERVLREFRRLDVLVNNAAEQHPQESLEQITPEQPERTFRTNIYSMFFLTIAALPHLQPGSAP